jgi:hypothetical protein
MVLEDTLTQFKDNIKKKENKNRFKVLNEILNKRKQQEINSIRNKFSQELHKLAMKHRRVNVGQDKQNIIKRHFDRKLNFYDPKLYGGCSKKNYCEEKIVDSKIIDK